MMNIENLYRNYGDVVLRRAEVLLKSKADAEEVLQEVFMKLMKNPKLFREESSPTTFLYRVTTNHCFNRMRNSKTRRRLNEEQVKPMLEQQKLSGPYETAALKEVLNHLEEDDAKIAVYRFMDGLKLSEVAEVMEMSRRNVSKRLNRIVETAQRLGQTNVAGGTA